MPRSRSFKKVELDPPINAAFSYNEYGWLTNKADALGHDVFRLSRNANGWVTTRWTPEFGNTAYGYDFVGNLTNVANGAVSNVYTFDALNQLTNVVDGLGTTKFTYSGGGQLATEDGPWVSDTVSYSYSEGQRTALTFGTWGQSYGYDASGRMTNLTSGAGTFGYSYNSGVSALISRLTLPNTGYLTNHYDTLARLDYSGLGNHWGQILDGYGYVYDANSQRTNIARDYGLTTANVTAGYDNIGQLTSWSGKEAGGALRWNEQLTYTYDAANNLRTRAQNYFVANQTFNVNAINEVTNVARIGIQTITGYTPSPATNVTVGSNYATNQAERYGDFTFASTNHLTDINNNTFTITAKNKYGISTTNSWTQDMPLSIGLQYDSNGNLTNDGVKVYRYDAWNQLTTNLVAGAWKTEYVYDGLGRKRIQRDYTWSGGAWSSPTETRYVYDGMLAVQERDASNNPLVTYTRGLDLSGSLQGAGGIGGLLARTDSSTTYYHSDGAGNITSLMNVHGDIVARYLYDPFGNLTAKWGNLADANHYRFSSKEIQPLSGLYYYGFRFYEPNLQRWINQDPIGEEGGMNLYGFVRNSPLNLVDLKGLDVEAMMAANEAGAFSSRDWNAMAAQNSQATLAVGAGAAQFANNVAFGLASVPGALLPIRTPVQDELDKMHDSVANAIDDYANAHLSTEAGYLYAYTPVAGDIASILLPFLKSECPSAVLKSECFSGETKIKTSEGDKPISEIEEGDLVWAFDEDSHATELRRVLGTFEHLSHTILRVHTDRTVIATTDTHPFWVVGKGWVRGKELLVGDILLSIKGEYLPIKKLEHENGDFKVYNLEVEGFHTYFVSDVGILVHNKPAPRGFKAGSGWYDYGGNPPFRRITNDKHHPRSASPEPRNVEDLFRRAIWEEGGGPGYVKDANGVIHRFSSPSNGETHWNGCNIPENVIPNEILKELNR